MFLLSTGIALLRSNSRMPGSGETTFPRVGKSPPNGGRQETVGVLGASANERREIPGGPTKHKIPREGDFVYYESARQSNVVGGLTKK